jgi:hypothetical protein
VINNGSCSCATSSSVASSCSVSAKCAPIAARSTFGDHSAVQPFSASTCRTPNAAAVRRMLPRLPASWIRSRTTADAPGTVAVGPGSASNAAIGGGETSALV